jgi:hypothetical protein
LPSTRPLHLCLLTGLLTIYAASLLIVVYQRLFRQDKDVS